LIIRETAAKVPAAAAECISAANRSIIKAAAKYRKNLLDKKSMTDNNIP
jgi:hypothetical protein